jgi:nitroreductase
MNDLLPEIEARRARRALDERAIPEEVVQRLLTAATLAPSCFNNQPWRFLPVRRAEELEIVRANLTSGNYWARKAPLVVLVLTEPELDCRLDDRRDYALFSCGLGVENLLLQATREGLIAHPIAGFKPAPIKEALGIPQELILITLVIVGYPGEEAGLNEKHRAQEHAPRSRKPLSEVVRYERW